MPLATTLNDALLPALTVWLCGPVVMEGGTVTVKIAFALGVLPPAFVTVTEYDPASVVWIFDLV